MSDSPAAVNPMPNSQPAADQQKSESALRPDDQAAIDATRPGAGATRIILLLGLSIALIAAAIWGLNYWHYATTHVSTDDAYVAGNLVSVSPTISGTLVELTVDEGSFVKKGQLIARLSDSSAQASVRQARANYNAALSQIPQAERSLLFQQETTNAAIRKAEAALTSQEAKVGGARRQVALTAGTTSSQVRQAESQLAAAEALRQQSAALARAADIAIDADRQAIQTALAAKQNFEDQANTAQKAFQAAQARADAAQAEVERTTRDEARYKVLFGQDAISAQAYDSAQAAARSAQANFRSAQAQVEEAQSQAEQAKAGVLQAQSSVEQARKTVAQAQAQARAAGQGAEAAAKQVNVARAGVDLARSGTEQIGVQRANLTAAQGQAGESAADILTAKAGSQEVAVRRTQIATYRAQAQLALAALNSAQINLNHTLIYAPTDGKIVKKVSNVGVSLAPGQTILTMTQGDHVWVTANFKETQLPKVHVGQTAEVEVDGVPDKKFLATVHSINEATGAATSLLPPDNATGNFTKVVQRIPVAIELIPAGKADDRKFAREEDIRNLRQGMSVSATINLDSATK